MQGLKYNGPQRRVSFLGRLLTAGMDAGVWGPWKAGPLAPLTVAPWAGPGEGSKGEARVTEAQGRGPCHLTASLGEIGLIIVPILQRGH